ncbi:hypothetical protein Dip518_000223 [Parelusimicrobium proximum]|uniref:hypothetical protein n=1 Tax=Parelusimicrobium proximum TaxID=3228953 RepID=UPI003D176253
MTVGSLKGIDLAITLRNEGDESVIISTTKGDLKENVYFYGFDGETYVVSHKTIAFLKKVFKEKESLNKHKKDSSQGGHISQKDVSL